MNVSPLIIASSIAGGTIGAASGFMIKGESAENSGMSDSSQLKEGLVGGLSYGLIGAGTGAVTAGTAIALKNILRK